jgi:hypothetical protein
VDLIDSLNTICWKTPHSRGHNNPTLFEKQTEPKGVEDCICYQKSYSVGFKWLHIKLGLTSAIEIKHEHMMNNLSVL